MTIEELDKVLTHKNISVVPRANPNELFERNRDFSIDGVKYSIEWYHNGCYLYTSGILIVFYKVLQSNTWPHMSKMNLQFENQDGSTVAVIKIEDYPKED